MSADGERVDGERGDALRAFYRGRRVLVTGHTGFKGAWLVAWLREAGAVVTGYALPAEPGSLFARADLARGVASVHGDVRDADALRAVVREARPELVLHLAAQSLVRRSYAEPTATFATNVMGTVHLLDAVRAVPGVRAVVVVTSDKCYEVRPEGGRRGYRERDRMGGHDPYSASKGCVELATAAFRRSYFADGRVAVATARAGNVVGGGDWAEDRLVPDLMRAAAAGRPVPVRNPDAVRPWQFVLEPLRGYLLLGRALVEGGAAYADGWNFGPRARDAVPVREVVRRMAAAWPRVVAVPAPDPAAPHEAAVLRLSHAKARRRLGWTPALSLDETVALTTQWYRGVAEDPTAAGPLLHRQLADYGRRVRGAHAPHLVPS